MAKRHARLATAVGLAWIMATAPVFWGEVRAQDRVRHVLLFIGDGMHLEHEIAASRYLTGRDEDLSFHRFPVRVYCTTWDVTTYNRNALSAGKPAFAEGSFDPGVGYDPARGGDAPHPKPSKAIDDGYFLTRLPLMPGESQARYPATDSASAATALATGHKTDDGNIAWKPGDPEDGALTTIAEALRDRLGWAIGAVSTVPFSHATPAAFGSHNRDRNHYGEIADELLRKTRPDVVIGGGHAAWGTAFVPASLYRDLKSGLIGDYAFVERSSGQDGAAQLKAGADRAAAANHKLLGLFGGPGGNFEPPKPSDTPASPSLTTNPENPTLRAATLAALQVLSRDKDGFFAVIEQGDIDWANHDNDFARMVGTVWDLDQAVQAAVEFVDRPGDDIDWENTLLIVTADHGNGYMRLAPGKRLGVGDLPTQLRQRSPPTPGGYASNWTYPDGEVTYRSSEHTNEPVTLSAKGGLAPLFRKHAGAWYPGTELLDNTQVYRVIAEAAGLDTR